MVRHGWMALPVMLAVASLPTSAGKAEMLERPYNLELRIDCPQQNVFVGDEIPIVFTITNKDKDPFFHDYYGDSSRGMWGYRLTARQNDGRLVPYPGEDELPIIGGPHSEERHVERGEAFRQTVALNRWARITEPGRYTVVGTYSYHIRDRSMKSSEGDSPPREIRVRSKSIEIEVKARSRRQMGEYIKELTSRLESLKGKQDDKTRRERERLTARLAYTCDTRIIPTMLDLLYERPEGNEHIEALVAFCCYLPPNEDIRAAVLSAIKARGLIDIMGVVMKRLDVSEADAAEVIRLSLASDDPEIVSAGITAAQAYPADEHMPRLIAIALDPNSVLPHGSIRALAIHRTDEGVAALRRLLSDPNADVRKGTASSIRVAYWMHPHYPGQVDEAYTAALVSIATDPNHPYRYTAAREIAGTRTHAGVKAVQALLADPSVEVALAETDLGVRTIRDLLRHADPDVREIAKERLKWACYEHPGRPLRPDDFPSEFRETQEGKKRYLEKWLKVD